MVCNPLREVICFLQTALKSYGYYGVLRKIPEPATDVRFGESTIDIIT